MKNDRSRGSNESSVLFSLHELMALEKDRLANEQAQEAARLEEAERARTQAEAHAAAAQAAARQAELARIAAEEELRQTERARRAAMQAAIVESARVSALEQAKLARLEAQQAHERALAGLHAGNTQNRFRVVGAALVVLLLGTLAGGAVLWMQARVAVRAQDAAHRAELERAQAKQTQVERDLALAEAEARRVAQELEHAKTPPLAPPAKVHGTSTLRTPGVSTAVKAKCHCREGDPLCRELPNGTCASGF